MNDELPDGRRCTCVRDDVRCSMGRASRSSDTRCEGCAMGLHKGHRVAKNWRDRPAQRSGSTHRW
jgi:hypothetical protein